jgi:hypothetical protein
VREKYGEEVKAEVGKKWEGKRERTTAVNAHDLSCQSVVEVEPKVSSKAAFAVCCR